MTEWVTGFVIPDVAQAHAAFARVLELAVQFEAKTRGTPLAGPAAARLSELRQAYVDFNDGLRQAARDAALQAERDISARAGRNIRPDTGAAPHLRDLIRCRPISVGAVETGSVGIADVSQLERAINPRGPGYGTYWRAQEYGTGGVVPSQVGRIIFGYFADAGGGDLTPPQAQYAGGGGPHPVFLSTVSGTYAGPRGGRGGLGTIGHEIQPKRFISLGKDAAAIVWRAQIGVVQQRAIDRLSAIGAP